MREAFRDIKLSRSNKIKLGTVNNIIEEYARDGYVMTLRQLYYQLVSRDIIPNIQSEYAKISKLLKEGRMAGIVDWDAIEDRLRVPYLPYYNTSPQEAVEDAVKQYRLDRQEDQDTYIEVWIEKDALSGVLRRVTSKYHVRLLVNRGYGFVTAIHDAYKRYKREIERHGKNIKLLYLGDHDPSGMDMIRDIRDRVSEMLQVHNYADVFTIEPIALTMAQIQKYNPPRNPAKLTDPRSKWYIAAYGNSSWEVDALDPKTLNNLVASTIEKNIDMNLFNSILETEVTDKLKLQTLIKNLK